MPVEVIRSPRRHKTVSAEVRDGRLVLRIPARLSAAEERRWIGEMTARFERRAVAPSDADLLSRARSLADSFGLPTPDSVRWSSTQRSRWGSATGLDRSIRISDRLREEPGWVLDYVIAHELAHLAIPDHSQAFWELVSRYPLAERARGFLMARDSHHAAS